MGKVKNQHFVPRFYLKHFTNQEGKIAAFDVRTEQSFFSNIEKVAQQKYFYDHKPLDDFAGDQAIEKALSVREGEAAAAYERLLEHLKSGITNQLRIEDRIIIAEHILMQMMRTPEHRKISEDMIQEFKRQTKGRSADEDFINKYAANFESKEQQLYNLFGTDNKEETWAFFDRYWIFWKNITKYKFYTSDHPVVSYMHRDLISEVYEIYYPLSSEFGLSLLIKEQCPTWKDRDNTLILLDDPETIKFYNEIIIRKCNRQIYCSDNDFRFAQKVLKTYPEIANPNRSRTGKIP